MHNQNLQKHAYQLHHVCPHTATQEELPQCIFMKSDNGVKLEFLNTFQLWLKPDIGKAHVI
jgi:hypothetical protein